MEAWYLAALKLYIKRRKEVPWVHELAAWLRKSKTAVYSALQSLEHKGWVTRLGTGTAKDDRKFVPVDP